MAQVKIQSIIEHRKQEIKRALEDAVSKTMPNAQFDSSALFRAFHRAVGRKSSTWVNVSDQDVKKECSECGEDT